MKSSTATQNAMTMDLEDSESMGDLLETSTSNISFATTAFSNSENSETEEKLLKDAMAESKLSYYFRYLLVGFLLAVAVGVTVFVFFYTKNAEEDDFELEFYRESDKVFEGIGRTFDLSMGSADAAMYQIISQARSVNATWPYATIPDFCVQTAKLLLQTKAIYVSLYPFIPGQDRSKWENFTAENHEWVEECIQVQNRSEHFHGPILEEYALANVLWETTGLVAADAPGPFMPTWLGYPVIPWYYPYNWNSFEFAAYSDPETASMDTISVVIAPVTNSAPPGADNATLARVAANNAWATNYVSADEDPSEPMAQLYYPVHDSIDDVVMKENNETKALGVFMFTFYFRHSLEEILADGSGGVIVVYENACGEKEKFTYKVNGKNPIFLGHEDLHDPAFDATCHSEQLVALSNLDGDYTGRPLNADFCPYTVTICPSQDMHEQYITNSPAIFAAASALVFLFLLTTVVFLLYGMEVTRRQKIVLRKALQAGNIVKDIFPAAIRDRLMQEDQGGSSGEGSGYRSKKHKVKSFLNDGMNGGFGEDGALAKPLADLYPETTILFADVANFTPWSSTRDPTQVFFFLQTIYQGFDAIAKRRKVFKVETVGDCYVAACGVPDANPNHAVAMANFAEQCLFKFNELTKKLEISLGPETADLKLRLGMHSGDCTAGVLRGERARFQLFGNTVNMASRMQSHGSPNRIHLSKATAELLIAAGRSKWVEPNSKPVHIKGKGLQDTFFLVPQSKYAISNCTSDTGNASSEGNRTTETSKSKAKAKSKSKREKAARLVEWNTQTLSSLLKPVVARREARQAATGKRPTNRDLTIAGMASGSTPFDEVQDVLKLPTFDAKTAAHEVDPETIELSTEVISQLRMYVYEISQLYRENHFHNFEHCSHVVSSVNKLLKRIVAPDALEVSNADEVALGLHDYTHGITSDPLTQFAVVFSALIHDVDHQGVSNMQLGKENPKLNDHYQSQSVAEQNSVDVAWELLMQKEYKDLRQCIYGDSAQDMKRFRQIVVAVVLATDIFDKKLKTARDGRWAAAFSEDLSAEKNRDVRATIVIEHLIQASDVSHTMQHWHVYRKWNERLFLEMFHAFKAGRMGGNPCDFWAKGEVGFFDNYIIPLAKKLKECNVFGVSSDEYLNYAVENRDEWAQKGEGIVEELKKKYCEVEKEVSEELVLETLFEELDDENEKGYDISDEISL